jgi:hypothetical protein
LGNVQKLADGDPLSGRTSAADDFGGNNSYNPNQQGQFQPQTYQTPAQPQYQQPQQQYQAPVQPQTQQTQQQYQDPAWFTGTTPGQQAGQQTGYPAQPQNNYGTSVPQYQQAPQYQQSYQQPYPQLNQQPQMNPVTGMPTPGGVMGI